jgi:hypothetical protein
MGGKTTVCQGEGEYSALNSDEGFILSYNKYAYIIWFPFYPRWNPKREKSLYKILKYQV